MSGAVKVRYSFGLYTTGRTLHMICVHTVQNSAKKLFVKKCAVSQAIYVQNERKHAMLSFLSFVSEVIAPRCTAMLKDIQGAVCLSC